MVKQRLLTDCEDSRTNKEKNVKKKKCGYELK